MSRGKAYWLAADNVHDLSFCYRVFGLTLRSNRELLGLDPWPIDSTFDFLLNFTETEDGMSGCRSRLGAMWYKSPLSLPGRKSAVEVWKSADNKTFLFHFHDDIAFFVDSSKKQIRINYPNPGKIQEAVTHLLFSLTGFLLGLCRVVCLHGAAIEIKDGAIALLGESNSGKSVLAAAMAAKGNDVFSDDLVALHQVPDGLEVHHGYPWICLRPKALPLLEAFSRSVGPFSDEWSYLDDSYITWDLRRPRRPYLLRPQKLKAIYLLDAAADSSGPPTIEAVPQPAALLTLLAAAGRTHIPYPPFMAHEFSILGSIAAMLPVRKLHYHLSAESLAEICDLLVSATCPQTA